MSAQKEVAEQTLRELLAKTSHPLLEVRTRSLRSLSLKLRSGLVSAESLVREQAFLSSLLQWFNFPEWGSQQLPLGLLDTLVEYEVAAGELVEMGAVEFLSQLRSHCDPCLCPTVDSILEKLLRIPPSLLPSPSPPPPSRETEVPTKVPHIELCWSEDNRRNLQSTTNPLDAKNTPYGRDTNSQQPERTKPSLVTAQSSVASLPLTPSLPLAPPPLVPSFTTTSHSSLQPPTSNAPTSSSLTVQKPLSTTNTAAARLGEGDEGQRRRRRVFPWLRLSLNDINILKTTENHLLSGESIQESCQFIGDVLFQDFPPHVFLQRPALLRVLFSLLDCRRGGGATGSTDLHSVCRSLTQLNSQLVSTVNRLQMTSADHFSVKDIHVVSTSAQNRPTMAATVELTNQIQRRRESHDLEVLTQDTLLHLQSSEVTLASYLSHVVRLSSGLLTHLLSKAGVGATSEGEIMSEATSGISASLQLLASTVELFEAYGRCGAGEGEEEDTQAIESLCSALSHSLALWRHISNKSPPDHAHSSAHHQLVCRVCLSLAWCLQRLLHCGAPSGASLSGVLELVRELALDGVVMVASPQLHHWCSLYLKSRDPTNHQVVQAVEELYKWFKNISSCLKKPSRCSSQATPTSLSPGEEVELATAALPSLHVFCNSQFVRREIRLTVSLLKDERKQAEWTTSRSLLLRLLAHDSPAVQTTAYNTFTTLLMSPGSLPSFPPSLSDEFLDLLCCHALFSPIDDVISSAATILRASLSAATSQSDYWMTNTLIHRLPYIEVSLEGDEGFFKELCDFIKSEAVPEWARLHSLLRMMFNSIKRRREYGCDELMKLCGLPSHPTATCSSPLHPMCDMFVTASPSIHPIGVKTALERNDIVQLLKIVRSPVMDELLKRSALQQLVTLLTDASLHTAAIEEDTLSTVLNVFKLKLNPVVDEEGGGEGERGEGEVREEEEEDRGFWKACVQCLCLLTLTLTGVRSQLCKDDGFLLGLFRASVKSSSDPEILQSSSALLASLVFSDVSRWTSDYTMQLPEYLLNRLKLTCPVGSYLLENAHRTPKILPPSQLPSQYTLSLLYHLGMARGNRKELLQRHPPAAGSSEEEEEEERGEMGSDVPYLRPRDLESIRYLWPASGLRVCVSRFRAARSHSEVSLWLDHMTLLTEYCHLQQQWQCNNHRVGGPPVQGCGECPLVIDGCVSEERCSSDDLKDVFGRFLRVKPATPQDKDLLCHLLLHLTSLLNHYHTPHLQEQQSSSTEDAPVISGDRGQVMHRLLLFGGGAMFLGWLVDETVAREESVCLQTLRSLQLEKSHSDRKLEAALVHFFASLSRHLPPSSSSPHRSLAETLGPTLNTLRSLSLGLRHLSLTQSDSLSSLHGCLQTLTHLSAKLCRSFGDTKVLESCTAIVHALKETVCSVVSGRGEMQASFMGQGLLKKATLSLSLLARAAAATTNHIHHVHNWFLECFLSTSGGFGWIYQLTHNRDPQIRCMGYSLLASMCSDRDVGERAVKEWAPHENFGLWGVLMGVAADRSECELVRHQAVEVLVALTAVCHRNNVWNQLLSFTDKQQTLTGAAALELFLRHHSPVQLLVGSETVPDPPTLTSSLLQLTYNLTLSFPALLCPRLEPLGDSILSVAESPSATPTLSPSLHLHLPVCRSTLDLLHVTVTVGSKVIRDFLLSGDNTLQLTRLLSLWETDLKDKGGVTGVCLSLLRLLVALWDEEAPPELVHVVPASLLSHWHSLSAILQWSLLHPSPPSLHTLSLSLLHSLLNHKLHPQSRDLNHASFNEKLTSLLDPTHQPQTGTDVENQSVDCPSSSSLSSSSGAELCAALLEVYDGSKVKITGGKGCGFGVGLVSMTMCLLLASSQSAKQTALKGGLLETSLEKLRGLHSQILCSDSSTNTQKQLSSHRRKDPPQVVQMCERLSVLQCLMYQSLKLKSVALEGGLVSLLTAMWPSCTVSVPLARAVLDMLTVFTARNDKGRTALAAGSRGSESLLYKIAGHASHCLSSHRSCLASRSVASPLSPVLFSSMSLAANCSLSSEGRRVLKKAAFLDHFTSLTLPPPPSSSSPQTRGVCEPSLWMKVLVNFTFYSDGQQTVIKLPGVVETVLDLYWRPDLVQPSLCLLTLRNLCFYGPGKTLLMENERFLSVLAGGLEGRRDMWTRAVTASALWALTHNCAKIRKTLRGTGDLVDKMTHLHSSLTLQQRATTSSPPPSSLLHLYTTNLTNAVNSLSIQ